MLIALESVAGAITSNRKKREERVNGVLTSLIVANLTRGDIEDNMLRFTLGDNKTYGGYVNRVLTPGATYTVRTAYVICNQVHIYS